MQGDVPADARDARRRSVPHGDDWTFEVKFDGYRAIAYVRGGECTLVSRNDNDLTGALPARSRRRSSRRSRARTPSSTARSRVSTRARPHELLGAAAGDGAARLLRVRPARARRRAALDLPLRERKQRLRELLDARVKTVALLGGASTTATRCSRPRSERGLEGVDREARSTSAYKPGRRTRDWLKIKTENNEEFVVAGYTRGAGRRAGTFGVARARGQRGRRAALRRQRRHRVRRRARSRKLLKLLKPLHRDTTPFAERAEDAARAQGRRAMGRAAARRAGAVRRVDARRPSAPSGLPRASARTRTRGEVTRDAAAARRDPQGQARAAALEPRQALLAGGGDHEGRPARATTRRSRRCSCRT